MVVINLNDKHFVNEHGISMSDIQEAIFNGSFETFANTYLNPSQYDEPSKHSDPKVRFNSLYIRTYALYMGMKKNVADELFSEDEQYQLHGIEGLMSGDNGKMQKVTNKLIERGLFDAFNGALTYLSNNNSYERK
ncbi:MAG: hypothetical protein ABIB43_03530 [archaeon]